MAKAEADTEAEWQNPIPFWYNISKETAARFGFILLRGNLKTAKNMLWLSVCGSLTISLWCWYFQHPHTNKQISTANCQQSIKTKIHIKHGAWILHRKRDFFAMCSRSKHSCSKALLYNRLNSVCVCWTNAIVKGMIVRPFFFVSSLGKYI